MSVDCGACGEAHDAGYCAWEQTCAECARTGVEMHERRLCVDCHEATDRATRRQRARDIYESRGDYLRDMQKDREAS